MIWIYFTQRIQNNDCLDMQMQDIFHIHKNSYHKQGMCLIVVEQLFHGDLLRGQ